MTEIPEHLLQRSRERRGALGLPGGEGGDALPAGSSASASGSPTTVVAKAAATAAAAPKAPPPPKPIRPEVVAALGRRKIPFWALPVVALLPIWLFIYAEAMAPATVRVTGPLAEGSTVFANCAGCHGDTGGGGVGYQLNGGEVLKSFSTFASQVDFVARGNKAFVGVPYGTGRHIGGQKGASGTMPTWGTQYGGVLNSAQLISVICHERFTLQGLGPDNQGAFSADYAKWCAPDAPEYVKAKAAAG